MKQWYYMKSCEIMGRKHNGILMIYFPNQKGVGVDYGNIEFKESTNDDSMYDLYPKDEKAEYFLFVDYVDKLPFRFVDKQDIPVIKTHRKYTTFKIDQICKWRTDDELLMYDRVQAVKAEFDNRCKV